MWPYKLSYEDLAYLRELLQFYKISNKPSSLEGLFPLEAAKNLLILRWKILLLRKILESEGLQRSMEEHLQDLQKQESDLESEDIDLQLKQQAVRELHQKLSVQRSL